LCIPGHSYCIMKQHRHLSLSRVATALLLTIVLSYRCSADESSNLRRAATMTGNNDDHVHVAPHRLIHRNTMKRGSSSSRHRALQQQKDVLLGSSCRGVLKRDQRGSANPSNPNSSSILWAKSLLALEQRQAKRLLPNHRNPPNPNPPKLQV